MDQKTQATPVCCGDISASLPEIHISTPTVTHISAVQDKSIQDSCSLGSPVIAIEKSNPECGITVIDFTMSPSLGDSMVESLQTDNSNKENSSYEAAEALCLMKCGGISAVRKDQDSSVADMCLVPEAQDGASKTNKQGTSFAKEVDVSVGSKATSSVTLNTKEKTNKQLIRYVLVPKTALLTSDRSGNAVPIQGTPYFVVMSSDGLASSNVTTIAAASLSSIQRCGDPVSQETSLGQLTDVSQEVEIVTESTGHADSTVTSGKKNPPKKHDALKFPPCVICGGEASGMHYGSNTCEACKNFFRRCLLRRSSPPFVCHGTSDCEISYKKNKNNCSACRLAKCLALGMAKEKCKMGRYTAVMRTETIKKVRKLEGKDDDDEAVSFESLGPCVTSTGPVAEHSVASKSQAGGSAETGLDDRDIYGALISKQIHLNNDEEGKTPNTADYCEELVQILVHAMEDIKPWGDELDSVESRDALVRSHFEKYRAKVDTFGKLSDVSMNEYWTLLRKYGIDIDSQWAMFKAWTKDWEFIIARYCKFAKQIPNFRVLSYDDQACLLKATHYAFFLILMHKGYYPEFNTFLELNGTPFHIEEASDKIFSGEFVKAMVEMMGCLQKLMLTNTEMALLMAIVTMSPDQCKVDNQEIIEETQLQLTNLLLRDMSQRYGHNAAMRKFTCIIDNLTKMREVSYVYYKEYKALCSDAMVREMVPNVDCVLPDDDL